MANADGLRVDHALGESPMTPGTQKTGAGREHHGISPELQAWRCHHARQTNPLFRISGPTTRIGPKKQSQPKPIPHASGGPCGSASAVDEQKPRGQRP